MTLEETLVEEKKEDVVEADTTMLLKAATLSSAPEPPSASSDHNAKQRSSPPSANDADSNPSTPTASSPPGDSLNKKTSTNSQFNVSRLSLLLLTVVVQTLVMDIPLLVIFAVSISTHLIEEFTLDYLYPQQDLQEFSTSDDIRKPQELTYYHRVCDERDLTATDTTPLIIDYDSHSPQDAAQLMMEHGASVYPNLLSDETAEAVRNWILQNNERGEDMIPVIENENRWSFGIRVDQDPTVTRTLKELLSNKFLVAAMEEIMGPNPAVIEFTGITSAYGAKIQRYHQDVVPQGNGGKWARNFIPSYSLFVPLQNISRTMGATEICPGSHMCADGVFDYCPDQGFAMSGEADNWPMGWGALVNQQLMHRGAAHSQEGGPHRVLFILTFAPRPQFNDYQVETRSIGQGGSYSLHWTQWGHTLRDFADPEKYMQHPWRLLRSMGLYKQRGRQWGWDYITQACARIANDENGFFFDDWVAMIRAGDFKYIPEYLRGNVSREYRQSSRDIWNTFYMQTLLKCRKALEKIHIQAVGAYVVVFLTGCLVSFAVQHRRSPVGMRLVFGCLRLGLIHAVVLAIAWRVMPRIANSCWGRNIKEGRLYTWPELPHVHAPSLYATLPTRDDILIPDDMQSDYLASYTEVLNVVHPGNQAWVQRLPKYAVGYTNLTRPLQLQLCSSLLKWSRQAGRRVLLKNDESKWAEALPELANRFCHKELLKLRDPTTAFFVRQLDFLYMETKFGYWRGTSMHQKWIPDKLVKMQDDILSYVPVTVRSMSNLDPLSSLNIVIDLTSTDRTSAPFHSTGLAGLPKKEPFKPYRRVVVSQEPKVDPLSLFWFNEGDTVEGAFGGLMTEWYRGEITYADANTMTWAITYDDGEEEFLCHTCVRPFVPFAVGDSIEWRDENFEYRKGNIVGVHEDDDRYDLDVSGRLVRSASPSNMRRMTQLDDKNFPLMIGSRVVAKYPGASGWFPGTLGGINSDGTYAVQFDDGDFANPVPRRQVRREE